MRKKKEDDHDALSSGSGSSPGSDNEAFKDKQATKKNRRRKKAEILALKPRADERSCLGSGDEEPKLAKGRGVGLFRYSSNLTQRHSSVFLTIRPQL